MNLHVDILRGPWILRFDSKRYLKVYRHETIPGLERYDFQSAPHKSINSQWYYEKQFYPTIRLVKNAILIAMGADPTMLDQCWI